jgi:hypothetical protein
MRGLGLGRRRRPGGPGGLGGGLGLHAEEVQTQRGATMRPLRHVRRAREVRVGARKLGKGHWKFDRVCDVDAAGEEEADGDTLLLSFVVLDQSV